MQPTIVYNREISDLRELAVAVMRPEAAPSGLSARIAARCLSGVVGLVALRWGTLAMQRACAELVRHDDAWASSFGKLPAGVDGRVTEPVEMIAVAARGILTLAGAQNMRAALSFWASESDPAVWTSVTGE